MRGRSPQTGRNTAATVPTTDMKFLALIALILQVVFVLGQRNWLPESLTAAEMWSPATWYYPQGIAAAEAWAEYLKNAQQATNQLYQQFDQTGASGLFNPGNPIDDGRNTVSNALPGQSVKTV